MNTETEIDLLELAQAFVAGRSLKRGDTIALVKGLLDRVQMQQATAQPVTASPALNGFCLAKVEATPQRTIFIGANTANRFYTCDEATALAGKILRTIAEVSK